MLPDFLPSAHSEEDSVVQHANGQQRLGPSNGQAFCFWSIFESAGRLKKVIHIVDERVHILLIKSGKIELDRCAFCTYTTASAEGLRSQSISAGRLRPEGTVP